MAQKKGQPELKLTESLITTDGGEWNTLSHAAKPCPMKDKRPNFQ